MRTNSTYSLKRLCAWLAAAGQGRQLGPVTKAARRVRSKQLAGIVAADAPACKTIKRGRRGAGALETAVRATMETLEARVMMSITSVTIYINDNWNITYDAHPGTGLEGVLSQNDEVANTGIGDDGSLGSNGTNRLVFGVNAFDSLNAALAAVPGANTIVFVSGIYGSSNSANLTRGATVEGWKAFAANTDTTFVVGTVNSSLVSQLNSVQFSFSNTNSSDTATVTGFTFNGLPSTGAVWLQDGSISVANQASVTVSNNTVVGASTSSVFVRVDSGAATISADNHVSGTLGRAVQVTGGSASVSGNYSGFTTGVDVTGGSAVISNATLSGGTTGARFSNGAVGTVTGSNFANGTDLQLTASSGAVLGGVNTFAGTNFFIDDQGSYSIDVTGSTFVGPAGNNFRIEDKMHHRMDTDLSGTVGLVTWNGNNVYVTNATASGSSHSIQRGVDAVGNSGWTVNVEAGTYMEQVAVNGKSLAIVGAGQSSTTIQSPVTLNTSFIRSPSPDLNKAVVAFVNGAQVNISSLTIDGLSRGLNNGRFIGLAYFNSGGVADHLTVTGIQDAPLDSNQWGTGIYGYSQDGTNRTLTVSNSNVNNYQKAGMALSGTNLTAIVNGNVVTGSGPQNHNDQTGIQVGFGANGTIENNTVSGNQSLGGGAGAGISLYQPSGATAVTANHVFNNDVGIFADPALVAQNTIAQNTIEHNLWGVELYGDQTGTSVHNNFIQNNSHEGIYIDTTVSASPNTLAIFNNYIVGNGTVTGGEIGLDNFSAHGLVVNASGNWWGSTYGPYSADNLYTSAARPTTGDAVLGSVTTTPWLNSGVDSDLVTPGFQPGPGTVDTTVPTVSANSFTITQGTFTLPVNDGATISGDWHLILNWGDGTTSDSYVSSLNISHVYVNPSGAVPYSVTVTLVDGSGNVATNSHFRVVVSDAPAVINVTTPVTGTITEGQSVTLDFNWADPGVNDTQNIVVNWGDGTTTNYPNSPYAGTISATHLYQDNTPGTAQSNFPVTITATDSPVVGAPQVGTASGGTVTVQNVAPTLVASLSTNSILENQSVLLSGTITDPGAIGIETFKLNVNWGANGEFNMLNVVLGNSPITNRTLNAATGDGGPGVLNWDPTTRVYTVSHTYRTVAGTGASFNYAVTNSVTDIDNAASNTIALGNVTVTNVNPSLLNLTYSVGGTLLTTGGTIPQGSLVTLQGTLTDPGTLDNGTLTLNWGAGEGAALNNTWKFTQSSNNANYTFNAATGAFIVTHVYTKPTTVTITASANDNHTGNSGSQTFTQTVVDVAPTIAPGASVPGTTYQNTTFTLSGSYSDPGSQDTAKLVINWDDTPGTPVFTTVTLSGGTINQSHTYAMPSTQAHNITFTVVDNYNAASPQVSVTTNTYNVAPVLTVSGSTKNEGTDSFATITAVVNDPGATDVFQLEINWPAAFDTTYSGFDKTILNLGTASASGTITDNNSISLATYTWSPSDRTIILVHSAPDKSPQAANTIAQGAYSVGLTVTDQYNSPGVSTLVQTANLYGSGTVNATITVLNVAPAVDSVQTSAPSINELDTLLISGTFHDLGVLDSQTLTLTWGDGGSLVLSGTGNAFGTLTSVAPGVYNFSASHQYVQLVPNGAPSATNGIGVKVADNHSGVGVYSPSSPLTVDVYDLPAILDTASLVGTTLVLEGGTIGLTGTFHFADSNNYHTVTVDWGDGVPVTPFGFTSPATFTHGAADSGTFVEGVSSGTFTITHTISDWKAGTQSLHNVAVTITDDNQGVSTPTLNPGTLQVTEVAPTLTLSGTLGVIANPGTLLEGGVYSMTGTLGDAGAYNNYVLSVNWGQSEGTATVLLGVASQTNSPVTGGTLTSWNPATGVFTITHQFLDVAGTNPSAAFTLTASAVDAANQTTATSTGVLTLNNLAPTITLTGIDQTTVPENSTVTLSAKITDANGATPLNVNDTFKVVTNWGTGETPTTITLGTLAITGSTLASTGAPSLVNWDPTQRILTATHVYATINTANASQDVDTITATVTDKNQGVGAGTLTPTLTVNNMVPGMFFTNTALTEGTMGTITTTIVDLGADSWTVAFDLGDNAKGTIGIGGPQGTLTTTSISTGTITTSGITAWSWNSTTQQLQLMHNFVSNATPTLSLTAWDNHLGTWTMLPVGIAVSNVVPTAVATNAVTTQNTSSSISLVLTDPGINDTWNVSVNWLDTVFNAGTSGTETISNLIRSAATQGTLTNGSTIFTWTPNSAAALSNAGTLTSTTIGTVVLSHNYASFPVNATAAIFTVPISVGDQLGTNTLTQATTVTNGAPVVTSTYLGLTSTVIQGASVTINVNYSDQGPADTHTITVDWGDGTPLSPVAANGTFTLGTQTLSGGTFTLPSHTYVKAGNNYLVKVYVNDNNNATSSTVTAGTITVANVAPTYGTLTINGSTSPTFTVNEGGSVTLQGYYSDPGTGDSETLSINWGDNLTQTVSGLTAGSGVFSVTHVYDDVATISADIVTLILADVNGGSMTSSPFTGTVNNVIPTLVLVGSTASTEGTASTITLTVTDPGTTNDKFTANVLWGDGKTDTINNLSNGSFTNATTSWLQAAGANVRTLTLTHVYADEDTGFSSKTYTSTVTLTDDNAGVSTALLTPLTINNVAPTLTSLVAVNPVVTEGGVSTLTATLVDPGTLDTWGVVVDWKDGVAGTITGLTSGNSFTDAAVIAPSGPAGLFTYSWTGSTRALTLKHVLVNGGANYNDVLTANTYAPVVTVNDDNLGTTTLTPVNITVNNSPPTILIGTGSEIVENGTATLTATIGDLGSQDVFSTQVNWQDGHTDIISNLGTANSSNTVNSTIYAWNGSTRVLTLQHQYLDVPSSASQGTYSPVLTVTDANSGTVTATATGMITVDNSNPVLAGALSPNHLNKGEITLLSGTITDVGTLDTFTLNVNWDHSEPSDSVGSLDGIDIHNAGFTWNHTSRTFVIAHQFLDGNVSPYSITATATDDHTGVSNTLTLSAIVDKPPVLNLSLNATSSNEGAVYVLHVGGLVDQGAPIDTPTGFAINWGDGSAAENHFGEGSPANSTYSHLYTDNGIDTISITLFGQNVHQDSGVFTLTVNNVAPTANLDKYGNVSQGGAGTVIFSNQFDPSSVDTSFGFRYSYDFNNDGIFDLGYNSYSTAVTSPIATVPADYLRVAGPHTIRARIWDKNDGFTDYTTVITTNNVAPTVTIPAVISAGTGIPTSVGGSFSDPGLFDTPWTGTVNYGDGSPVLALAVNSDTHTFPLNHTYATAGAYQVTVHITDNPASGTPQTGTATMTVNVVNSTLQVIGFTPTASGFDFTFNRPIGAGDLKLYGANNITPPITVVGTNTGPATGSLIWDAATNTAHWVQTYGVLASDRYTITLVSGTGTSNSFHDTQPVTGALDGDANGTAGDNYVNQVNVTAPAGVILSMPDFARGPTQPLNVALNGTASPNGINTAVGLPITLSNGAGVSAVDFELDYNPADLSISAANPGLDLPAGWSITVNNNTSSGVMLVSLSGPGTLTAGLKQLVALAATVPGTTLYGASEMLHLTNVSVNGGAIVATGEDAVHKAVYLGDVSGDGHINSLDASLISSVVVHLQNGFSAYPLTDPRIMGDVSGNQTIDGLDASLVSAKAVHLSVPQIPDPGTITLTPAGIDPTVQIGNPTQAAGFGTTVPVSIRITDNTAGLTSIDLTVSYDTLLSISGADVSLGSSLTGWNINENVLSGTIYLSAWTLPNNPLPSGPASLFNLNFHTPASGPGGTANLAIADSSLYAGISPLTVTPVNGSITVQNNNTIAGRDVFYNNSIFDGNNPNANAADDNAIDTTKSALLPGGAATFANYTSYDKGLNGIMVDINGPVNPLLSASDFGFKVGNSNTPAAWTILGVTPTVTVRPGAGVGGSTRVEIIFPDGSITKKWLEVRVKAGANTNLAADDVFYFGNAVGEACNSIGDAKVTAFDELAARANPLASGAVVTNRYDHNRDGAVDVTDQTIARSNVTSFLNALNLINLSVSPQTLPTLPAILPTAATPTGPAITPTTVTTGSGVSAGASSTTTTTTTGTTTTKLTPVAANSALRRLLGGLSKLRLNLLHRL